MDNQTKAYMKDKVTRYEQLENFKSNLNEIQQSLVNDEEIKILVGYDTSENDIGDYEVNKAPCSHIKDEYEELLREIKDNLIDSIGMKIVEIEEKMKEL